MRYYYNLYKDINVIDIERVSTILRRIFDERFIGCGVDDDRLYIDIEGQLENGILNVAVTTLLGVYNVDD